MSVPKGVRAYGCLCLGVSVPVCACAYRCLRLCLAERWRRTHEGLLCDVEGRIQVDADHPPPLGIRHLVHRRGGHRGSRVVEQQVQPAVLTPHSGEEPLDVRRVAEVRRAAAERARRAKRNGD